MRTPDGAPTSLIRAFKSREYLECFLSGRVRLQRLEVYREIEDRARRDAAEGEARLIVPGVGGSDVQYGGSFHNPVYLLCCSEPVVGLATVDASLGDWIAHIRAPRSLLSALRCAAEEGVSEREVIDAMLLRVAYSKGDRVAKTPSSDDRFRLMLAQKDQIFEPQREWRYAVVLSGAVSDSAEELWLTVDGIRETVAAIWSSNGAA